MGGGWFCERSLRVLWTRPQRRLVRKRSFQAELGMISRESDGEGGVEDYA